MKFKDNVAITLLILDKFLYYVTSRKKIDDVIVTLYLEMICIFMQIVYTELI